MRQFARGGQVSAQIDAAATATDLVFEKDGRAFMSSASPVRISP